MLNVRPRPLVVKATGAIQQNNTPVDPKPRTHTKQATTPISKCSQLSHTHAVELATLKLSLLNAVSHLLFPTSLFFSVFFHVFALFFRRLEHPPQRLPTLFLLNSSALLLSHFYLFRLPFIAKKTFSILNSSCLFLFFLSSLYLQWLSPRVFHAFSSSRLFFSLPQYPLSPSYFSLFFFRTSHTCSRWLQRIAPQPVLPEPWRPTSTRTSTSLWASCQARSLLAGPRLLPFGVLCQRGVETQAVTPSCPIT